MSKRWAVWGCAMLCAAAAAAGVVDADLQALLARTGANDVVSTIVCLSDVVNVAALDQSIESVHMDLQQRHEIVIRTLQEKASSTQGPLIDELQRLQAAGQVTKFEAYWITNALRVDALPAAIQQLADRADVRNIYVNSPIYPIEPVRSEPAGPGGTDTPEPGLVAINAPQVWALGIDGTGVLVSTLDTGVNFQHPALHNRWAGLDPRYAGHPEWAWKVAAHVGGDPNTPSDGNGHGTHTMGTVCGGAPGDQIGVAPGAHWIASNAINQGVGQNLINDVLAAWQWIADPDGNPSTVWDVPATNSNSWGTGPLFGEPHCYNPGYWEAIDACEAAGVVVLFSAGNEGPGADTLRIPADRATDDYRNLAVAAVDGNTAGWPIANFSSRGPTNCTPGGGPAIKPDISAPGVHVRSSYGSGYEYLDGTSMASPHVNGVCALMRQACPSISVTQIKQIIYQTARDLGPTGEDNSYGWGMIDAYACVQAAQGACGPHPPHAADGNFSTPINTPVNVTLVANSYNQPPPVLTYIVVTLPTGGHLFDVGTGSPINAVPYTLANNGKVVKYQPNNNFSGNDSFQFKANDGGQPPQGGDSNIATVTGYVDPHVRFYSQPLDTDPGWTISGGQWQFGRPQGGSGDHGGPDPTSGHTGQNVYGYNNGYPNGGYVNNMVEYHLTAAPIDCSNATQVQLRYWRWLGVEQNLYDHAYIRVSIDGSNWNTVWSNPADTLDDQAWVAHTVDISALADHQPHVYLRWTMGTTDVGWTYCGWNIDDIELWGAIPNPLHPGDLNCDGAVNFDDINPFVLALSDPAGYQTQYPNCNILNGDINGDGLVNFDDINPFVALLTGP